MPPTDDELRVAAAAKDLLRVQAAGRPVSVDRKENVLRGYVVMNLGPLKDRPGEADMATLEKIVELGNARKQGLKSRFGHPTECSDGLGKYLGRAKDFYLGEATTRDGRTIPAVRADLHFDPTALQEMPNGGKPLGLYVMDLAESDADALSSSVVVRFKREYRVNPDGTRKKDEKTGEELPPLLRPTALFATDIVDEGAAVDAIFSADDLPNGHLWHGAALLDGLFDGLSRGEVSDRLNGWLTRYLDDRFGAATPPPAPVPVVPPPEEPTQPELSTLLLRQRQRERESLA